MNNGAGAGAALLGALAFGLTGCAAGLHAAPPVAPFSQNAPLVDQIAAVPIVSGTYAGEFSETEGTKVIDGTVKITVQQDGSKISGKFTYITAKTKETLPFSGSVRKSLHGAKLKFVIRNPNGRSATGKATVKGVTLKGTAYAAPSGSKPAVYIKFVAKKQ